MHQKCCSFWSFGALPAAAVAVVALCLQGCKPVAMNDNSANVRSATGATSPSSENDGKTRIVGLIKIGNSRHACLLSSVGSQNLVAAKTAALKQGAIKATATQIPSEETQAWKAWFSTNSAIEPCTPEYENMILQDAGYKLSGIKSQPSYETAGGHKASPAPVSIRSVGVRPVDDGVGHMAESVSRFFDNTGSSAYDYIPFDDRSDGDYRY